MRCCHIYMHQEILTINNLFCVFTNGRKTTRTNNKCISVIHHAQIMSIHVRRPLFLWYFIVKITHYDYIIIYIYIHVGKLRIISYWTERIPSIIYPFVLSWNIWDSPTEVESLETAVSIIRRNTKQLYSYVIVCYLKGNIRCKIIIIIITYCFILIYLFIIIIEVNTDPGGRAV
jgi:hypothetical protein